MSSSPRAIVTELQQRAPTPAQQAEDLRVELYLEELRRGPPFPLWRILQAPPLRAYAPDDELDCYRLELELGTLRWRWWKTEYVDELHELTERMLRIAEGLDGRSIGTWQRSSPGGRLYLVEGRPL